VIQTAEESDGGWCGHVSWLCQERSFCWRIHRQHEPDAYPLLLKLRVSVQSRGTAE